MADEHLSASDRERVLRRLETWLDAELHAKLKPLVWLAEATNLSGLARGLVDLGVELLAAPEVNMAYARIDDAVADRLEADGLDFYRMGDATIRLVTSFETTADDVERALKAFASAVV